MLNKEKLAAHMAIHHVLRVRGTVWEAIEKKAWEFSIKENKVIKPTDLADALLRLNLKELKIEDVKKTIESR